MYLYFTTVVCTVDWIVLYNGNRTKTSGCVVTLYSLPPCSNFCAPQKVDIVTLFTFISEIHISARILGYMGPSRNDTTASLLEKDQEISRLKLQLRAHAARTSLIQSRVITTQNALDALQASHDEELRAEQSTSEKLRRKLLASYEYIKSLKKDKDDLCNAAASFLQRGM